MLGEVRIEQHARRDRTQHDALISEMQISAQARRHHPFQQWGNAHTSEDFDGRDPHGVIPGTRATGPETRRALGHTSHLVGPGTQAALDALVDRIQRDLAVRARPVRAGIAVPPRQDPGSDGAQVRGMEVDSGAAPVLGAAGDEAAVRGGARRRAHDEPDAVPGSTGPADAARSGTRRRIDGAPRRMSRRAAADREGSMRGEAPQAAPSQGAAHYGQPDVDMPDAVTADTVPAESGAPPEAQGEDLGDTGGMQASDGRVDPTPAEEARREGEVPGGREPRTMEEISAPLGGQEPTATTQRPPTSGGDRPSQDPRVGTTTAHEAGAPDALEPPHQGTPSVLPAVVGTHHCGTCWRAGQRIIFTSPAPFGGLCPRCRQQVTDGLPDEANGPAESADPRESAAQAQRLPTTSQHEYEEDTGTREADRNGAREEALTTGAQGADESTQPPPPEPTTVRPPPGPADGATDGTNREGNESAGNGEVAPHGNDGGSRPCFWCETPTSHVCLVCQRAGCQQAHYASSLGR